MTNYMMMRIVTVQVSDTTKDERLEKAGYKKNKNKNLLLKNFLFTLNKILWILRLKLL